MRRYKLAVWIAIFSLIGTAGFYMTGRYRAAMRRDHVYRIGWENDPPFQQKDAHGAPTGFAVDLVREAARRRGIRLEWVEHPGSSEDSLRQGLVDLWPLITITPERKRFLHISQPYLQHDHYLVVREDSQYRQLRELSHAAVSVSGLPIAERLARRTLPDAHLVRRPTTPDAIADVCGGSAEAALVEEFAVMSTLLGGSRCPERPLRVLWVSELETTLGIGATFPAAGIADEIREEIGQMGRDESLTRVMADWGYYLPRNLQTMNTLLNEDRVRRQLVAVIAVFALLTLLALGSALYILRQRNRIRREINEREHAETGLRERERRFRELLEGSQLAAIIIDRKGRISFCNDYTLAISGWGRDEVIGRSAQDLLEPSYLQQLAEAMEEPRRFREQRPFSESALLTRSGDRRMIQWTSTVLRDLSGLPEGFASLGEDITELTRLRAEAATRESEERFRAIFQQAAVGVAQLDREGCIVLANDRYCATLGRTREELTGTNFRTYTHPDDVEPQLRQMQLLQRGDVSAFSTEQRYFRKDGAVAWARLNVSMSQDETNRSKYYIAILEDITESKRAEAALRESEERFRNMADTAPVMIWVAGTDKGCTFVSKGWLSFTGRRMEQESGNGWSDGVHAGDVARCLKTYTEAFDARRPFAMEYRLRSAEGSYRWVKDEGVPRFGPDGVFAGYIGCCVDITEIKRSHEEALARQKLESLGVLAGGIAHDFNNLLGSIMADSELAVADLEPGSPAWEGIGRIHAVALRAAEIVRQLLSYAGRESTIFEPVDISAVVGEMLQLVKVSVSKSAVLKVDLPENFPPVRANAAQIRQVVLNLVTNASEALEGEAGIITVRTSVERYKEERAGLAPGRYLRLEVSDTGCGMTPELTGRIFDPFFTTKFTGRGLGLAAVQGIVRAHGGAIGVVSAPGKGTRFEIILPCFEGQVMDRTRAQDPASQADAAAACGTVLVVEDEAALRVPVCRMLRRSGFAVIEAADGVRARDLFLEKREEIDAVLLDLTLPGMSGHAVADEIQHISPGMRIILTTAYSQEEAIAKLAGQGTFAFIRKPYVLKEVVALLKVACAGRNDAVTANPSRLTAK